MKISDTKSMITAFKDIHGDKYDYSESIFVNYKTKVKIICPIHGVFEQSHYNHIRGAGCKKCGITKAHIGRSSNTDSFINKAIVVHGSNYDYDKVNYVNAKTYILITCKIHGDFKMRPSNHLSGRGCPACGNISTGVKLRLTNNEFISKAKKIHGNIYDYSKVKYVKSYMDVTIICPTHGEFKQKPNTHIMGSGCPMCAYNGGFSKSEFINIANSRLCVLYKILCWNKNEHFYKIGRTSFTTKYRFRGYKMPYNYRIVSEQVGDAGYIYDLEKKEHRRHNHLKYKPKISFCGITECFTKLI